MGAATENPNLVRTFGVRVPRMLMLTYGLGVALAGFGLGVIEGITKLVYPDGAGMVVFVVMLIVLAVRPQGLFGSLR